MKGKERKNRKGQHKKVKALSSGEREFCFRGKALGVDYGEYI